MSFAITVAYTVLCHTPNRTFCILCTILAVCWTKIFLDAIDDFEGGNRTVYGPQSTANIFAPYPPKYLSLLGAYIDQVISNSFAMLIKGTQNNETSNIRS